ncbi:cytokine-inducible SH2-containing protein [Hippoglossus stenolepis]|uniref:cytokine-inducible SH2-containing protein n=1 Tax=Hippoglossus stenolepis TaxID=195615 RepID=UPI00159C5D38|nr:cytokine-inducible SH2-containing protein [Hippoglossus stenolepis]XP_035007349.1 cytokine-inducible SH2-containing protein [Hippoglossus stenolepis]
MVARAVTISQHEEREASCCSHPSPPCWDPAEDLRCIATTFQYLQTSGWYWGSLSASDARKALLTKSEGTFLVRDSSHPQYVLALSVKTRCGPTSVRIEYSRGCFWLDSISPGLPHLQSFPDVLTLIQHYKSSGHAPQDQASNDFTPKAKPDPASGVPLNLMQPLHKPEAFPSLQHLARLTINRHTNCPEHLPLPRPLLRYLQDYPFHI